MKKTKTLVFLFLALTLVLSACQPDSTTSTTAIVTSDPDPTNGSLSEDLAEPGSDDFGWWNELSL